MATPTAPNLPRIGAPCAILNGSAQSPVRVVCDGGALEVAWSGSGTVKQIGEVELLFEGEWMA